MRDFFARLLGRRADDGALSCQELVELVTDYFEGALLPADRVRFESHIAGCDGCTTYVQQMREMLEVVGSLTTESLSVEAEAELLAAFRDWKAR
jgi:anti-sigma factor RsiW